MFYELSPCFSSFSSNLLTFLFLFCQIEFDSNQYEDAVDLLLDAWVVLVSNLSCFTDNYFMSYTVQVFNCYLKTHLEKPDGVRKDDSEGNEVRLFLFWCGIHTNGFMFHLSIWNELPWSQLHVSPSKVLSSFYIFPAKHACFGLMNLYQCYFFISNSFVYQNDYC